jgi:hypothetical protein
LVGQQQVVVVVDVGGEQQVGLLVPGLDHRRGGPDVPRRMSGMSG